MVSPEGGGERLNVGTCLYNLTSSLFSSIYMITRHLFHFRIFGRTPTARTQHARSRPGTGFLPLLVTQLVTQLVTVFFTRILSPLVGDTIF